MDHRLDGITRVAIVEDHPFVREALRDRLARVAWLEVVGEAECAGEALSLIERQAPHVLLTDIGLKGMSGLELAVLVAERHPAVKVAVLSMFDRPEFVQEALRAGVRGYILKDSTSEQIIGALRAIASGGTYMSPSLGGNLFDCRRGDRLLSPREEEVLRMLAKGLASKQIATSLGIGRRTVESHRQSLKRKLCIDGQAQLIKFAVERFSL
jgi:DNA-binding NarL/FixJ family response regulator